MLKDALTIVQLLAIILGGVWAYFKFVAGRTFRARLEPTINGKAVKHKNFTYLYLSATVKNVGLSKVMIDQDGSGLRVWISLEGWSKEVMAADWKHLGTFPIFKEHAWIEPGEVISDEQMIVVPDKNPISFKLELRISNRKFSWTGTGLVECAEDEETGRWRAEDTLDNISRLARSFYDTVRRRG
jgi:hypothetical protein